ncbi:tRNA 5-methylaminomethyl-2-thiouridine biosynthesis bifunctional protein MnmC [Bienertia sinuspersici]
MATSKAIILAIVLTFNLLIISNVSARQLGAVSVSTRQLLQAGYGNPSDPGGNTYGNPPPNSPTRPTYSNPAPSHKT